jgi:outer membrane receptor protein involved in Fe transport
VNPLFRNVAVVAAVSVGGATYAQGLGVVQGTVTDSSTGKAVTDVVVTATSPAKQGEELVVSDGSGNYYLSQLPPGTYTLRFEKESFKPFSRADIVVRADRTLRVNVELLPEALKAEEVVIVSKAPVIDVGSAATGQSVSADFVKNIAVSRPTGVGGQQRSFESLAVVAPQAQPDTYGVSINGTTSPENGYLIDGLSVGDPAFGINGTELTSEFVQEVNVVTGGYMPEYGRSTGGVLSAVTKTGSNTFKGSVWGTWTPGGLQATPRDVKRDGSAISSTSNLVDIGDIGADIGGPIIKDKLWFYAGIAPSFSRYRQKVTYNKLQLGDDGQPKKDEQGFTLVDPISGSESYNDSETRTLQFLAKLTWAISPDHSLTAQVSGTPTQSIRDGSIASATRNAGLSNGTSNVLDAVLKLNSSFLDKKLLIDATAGWHSQSFETKALDGSGTGTNQGIAGQAAVAWQRTRDFDAGTDYHNILDFIDASHPGYANTFAACDPSNPANVFTGSDGNTYTRCPVTTYRTGGAGYMQDASSNRWQGRVVGTYLANLLGKHVIKAGVDAEATNYTSTRAYTGRYFLTERLYGNGWTINRNFGHITAPNEIELKDKISVTVNQVATGAFVQDSWSILDKVTLNAGLRYDTQNMYGSDGALAFSLPSQLSPRLGLIWDPTQSGRAKVYANYAVYYSNVPLNIADRAFGQEKGVYYRVRNAGCSPLTDANYTQNCNAESNLGTNPYTAGTNSPNGSYFWTAADKTVVDPNLQPMATNEFVAGAEYQVVTDGRLGVTYTRRDLMQTIEDMSVDNASSYFIGNPGFGVASPFPKASREYQAGTLFFDKTFSDGWMAQASYTLSRLYGNYGGLFVAATGQLDPNSNATFDLVSLLANQTGFLDADRTHQLKAFGAKSFQLTATQALTLGLSYNAQSGAPINYLAAHPIYGPDEAYVLPRGVGGRTPWTHRFDSRISYDLKLTDTNTLSVGVDVFNLFNFQETTAVDETYTSATILPLPNGTKESLDKAVAEGRITDQDQGAPFTADGVNPNFGKPVAYQSPRNVRFGVRFTF